MTDIEEAEDNALFVPPHPNPQGEGANYRFIHSPVYAHSEYRVLYEGQGDIVPFRQLAERLAVPLENALEAGFIDEAAKGATEVFFYAGAMAV